MSISKVYIPQEPTRRGPDGELISLMNFAQASRFGETEVCLPPGQVALSPQPTIQKLRDCLRNFSDKDYLIAVGDPSVIAMAAAVCAMNNRGRFNLLKYDKGSGSYIKVQVDLYHRPGKED